jgi:hypothetical protein
MTLLQEVNTLILLQFNRPACVTLFFSNLWETSYTISVSTSVDVQQWPPYSTNDPVLLRVRHNFLRNLPRPAIRRKRHLFATNCIIIHDTARVDTADAVEALLLRWQWEILKYPSHSPDMSQWDYDPFVKLKEPLRGTRYSTREENIGAVGRSLLDINGSGRSHDVSSLPQKRPKLVHMRRGGDYIEGM